MLVGRFSPVRLFKRDDVLVGRFTAMNCPCEVLIDTADLATARELADIAAEEAWRIEKKFSRYADSGIVNRINTSAGAPVSVDDETANLLDYADRCFTLSGGLFDITSGILRRAWTFDGREHVPDRPLIARLLPMVGLKKATWRRPMLQLLPDMEIDFGGIGKEYAVDRALRLIGERSQVPVLVNFGGDVAVARPRANGLPWFVGIESSTSGADTMKMIPLRCGALATSGDSKRFVMIDGKRYVHILDPRTGWPVADALHSVTVAADTCSEAGFLSTYAILNGKNARAMLAEEGVQSWCE